MGSSKIHVHKVGVFYFFILMLGVYPVSIYIKLELRQRRRKEKKEIGSIVGSWNIQRSDSMINVGKVFGGKFSCIHWIIVHALCNCFNSNKWTLSKVLNSP